MTDITVDDTGRYGCRVVSTCGESDLVHSDVSAYQYEYVCDNVTGQSMCIQNHSGGSQTVIRKLVCDDLNLPRPRCNTCDWLVGPWSSCTDTTCDRGKRRRQVICDCEGRRARATKCLEFSPKPDKIERCGSPGLECGNVL